ncbi:MAG: Mandelate racemase/muconate lactonizing enzyme N-terminal domain protein [Bryobacterales bacterium]|nr:Mandelate racemase/muconate lactonizing enzyme N-terminal domain protein [Bryobacterales bacterium]
MNFNRRLFLKTIAASGVSALSRYPLLQAAMPKMKITRIRAYQPPNPNPLFNQADTVVTIETDAGITGIGEGGFPDTLRQPAGRLIGQDPQYIEKLWQDVHRSYFYPPGREKEHAHGALDMALWDIRGKVLKMPVHQVLGGMSRNYCECYNTAGIIPGITPRTPLKERAAATIAAGYRAFRMGAADTPANTVFNVREKVNQMRQECADVRAGVGSKGDWCIDFHQRFDYIDAVRGCDLIEEYAPLFVEDPVRAEGFNDDLPRLRKVVKVPIAAGEEWGNRWDFNKLIENHDIDWMRGTLPNVGGITEMMKIAALCETHFIGIVPHFTGPIATAAIVNSLGTYSGPLLLEYNYQGRTLPHLPACLDFKDGKLYPNERPGLGVEFDSSKCTQILEVTKFDTTRVQTYFRPDGSITNW